MRGWRTCCYRYGCLVICAELHLDFVKVEYVATARSRRVCEDRHARHQARDDQSAQKEDEEEGARAGAIFARVLSSRQPPAVFVAEHPVPNAHPLTHRSHAQFVDDDDNIQYMSEDELDPTVMSDTPGRGKLSARAHSSKASKLIEAEQEDDDAFGEDDHRAGECCPHEEADCSQALASNVGRPVEIFFPEVGQLRGHRHRARRRYHRRHVPGRLEETLSPSRDAQPFNSQMLGRRPRCRRPWQLTIPSTLNRKRQRQHPL